MSALTAREAYPLWAPAYEEETAVSYLENLLVARMGPSSAGRRLLDVGCGTGRRLREAGAAFAVGVDLSPEMLSVIPGQEGHWVPAFAGMTVGEATALPLAASLFELVWCRLMIGHVASPASVYAELGRVARPGATVVVTDFHPAAVAAGHRRTFRDQDGLLCEIEHFVHPLAAHIESAAAAGLALVEAREGTVGPEILPFFARAGREAAYREQMGMPLVLGLTFVKAGEA